jgi:hypothetical protein
VGTAALRVLGAAGVRGPSPEPPVTILFGLCCFTVLGGAWSLVAPLGVAAAAAGVAVLGASLAIVLTLPRLESPAAKRDGAVALLAALAAAVALAQSASTVWVPDTALYHIQAIRWIEQHAAVPGLANLFDRLAFSAPWFEAQALFDPVLFGGRPVFALNGMVFVTAVSFFLGGLAKDHHGFGLSRLLRLGCVPAAFWLLRRGLSSASPDGALALLSWVLLVLLAEKSERGEATTLDAAAWVIATLGAFAAVTKLSAAPLLLAPTWLVVCNLRRDRRRALALAGVSAAVAAPFVVRNVIVSGYLLFPVPWTRVPGLGWTVPPARVAGLVALIGDWARLPNRPHVPACDVAAWLPTWAHNLTVVERLFLAALPVLGLVHAALLLRRASGSRTLDWPPGTALLIGLTLAGTLLWLLTAPDPRFAWGFFPFLALLLVVPLVLRWIARVPRWALALLLAVVLLDQGRRVLAYERQSLQGHWLWPVPPPMVETTEESVGGLTVRVPAGALCWDMPLPCVPSLDPGLAPRGTSLEEGFTVRDRY